MFALILIVVSYGAPVIFGVPLFPDLNAWVDGYFVTIGESLAPWLGSFMLLAALLANVTLTLGGMAAYSRCLTLTLTLTRTRTLTLTLGGMAAYSRCLQPTNPTSCCFPQGASNDFERLP